MSIQQTEKRCQRSSTGRLAILLPLVVLVGLSSPTEARGDGRSLRFERLSLEQGLSQGTVNCILQDRAGYLWLGSQEGLNRYDGHRFRVYKNDPTDPASLPANWIASLAEDRSGQLWIGTDGGGLARFDPAAGAFVRFRHHPGAPASLSSDRIRSLLVDRSGTLWVATSDAGLNRFDAVKGTFERFRHDPADPASLAGDRLRSLAEDRAGQLWVGSLSGLSRLHRAAGSREGDQQRPLGGRGGELQPASGSFLRWRHDPADPASLSDDRVLSILEDRHGALWVGTEDGLNRLQGSPPAPQGASHGGGFVRYRSDPADPASLGHHRVRALFEDDAGRLWIGTDGGVSLGPEASDPAAATAFVGYRHHPADPASLSNDRVVTIAQDRGGIVWIGTQGGGVNKFDPRTSAFAHHQADPANNGLSDNNIFALSEDGEGRLWIGTLGGLDFLDRASGRYTHYRHRPDDPTSLPDDRVSVLLHDRQGTLWAGAIGHGLSRFDPRTETFEHFRHDPDRPGSLGGRVVSVLYEDRQGLLWVGTYGGGLDRFDGAASGGAATGRDAETFVHHRHDPELPDSLSDNQVTAIAEHAAGHLWVGTFHGGLNRLDRWRGTFRRLRHQPDRPSSLSSDTVYALHVDAAGVLWVGTRWGLNKLETLGEEGSFRRYFERHGLPNDVVCGIRSDDRGRLWLATSNGLSRFDPASETFKNYRRSHGLQANEFNFNAHYRGRSGELFFGGTGGFNAFDPDSIEDNPHPPAVVVTSVTKLNRPVAFERALAESGEIALGHRDYFFSVEVAALDFAAPQENRYRYKLEGFDADWVDLGHRRQMTFTNLDAGRYTLRLQGSNSDGLWNETGTRLKISIAPAPWETWWARALYALAVGLAVGGFILHHHRKLERERAVTRRERAQAEERQTLLKEREELIEELEAKNVELERFNYTVSHDLKSPLVTIKSFLGLLERDAENGDTERLKHDLRRIRAAADRMRRLLDELLELSRVGRQVRPPENVPLAELAQEAAELVVGHADERGVEMVINPALPVVFGDRLRLFQLYQNLLANAVKYMGEQGAPRVEVGVRRDAKPGWPEPTAGGRTSASTVLFVRDNGIGIDERYHEKVFGLFERLDPSTEGTGIGLALARRIVEMHGGNIWVESEGPGRGSVFCFTLPGQGAGEDGGRRAGGRVVDAADRFQGSSRTSSGR